MAIQRLVHQGGREGGREHQRSRVKGMKIRKYPGIEAEKRSYTGKSSEGQGSVEINDDAHVRTHPRGGVRVRVYEPTGFMFPFRKNKPSSLVMRV